MIEEGVFGNVANRALSSDNTTAGDSGGGGVGEAQNDASARRREGGECRTRPAGREDVAPPRERAHGDDEQHPEEADDEVSEEAGEHQRDRRSKNVADAHRRHPVVRDQHGADEFSRDQNFEEHVVLP